MGTQFNAPSTTIPRSKDIPSWDAKLNQWIPQRAPFGQSQTITSTGAFGPYAVTFATPYKVAPTIVFTTGLAGGNFTIVNITAVTTTGFTFSVGMFSPGILAVPNLTTFLLNWIAIGT